jgi:chaperonin cofactor prefoldin
VNNVVKEMRKRLQVKETQIRTLQDLDKEKAFEHKKLNDQIRDLMNEVSTGGLSYYK